jgi:hypothetical protein
VVQFVYDDVAGEVRAYLNGVLNNTVAQTGVNIVGTAPFKVGAYSSSNGMAAGELMDEFKLYNRAIDLAEGPDQDFWLAVSPESGTIAPGGSQEVVLTFDPAGLLGGDYDSQILVSGNDPVNPEDTVGVHMFVIAEADIAASPDSVIFPTPIVIGVTDTSALTVYNNGAGVLDVTGIASSNSVFTVSSTTFTVAPFDSVVLDVFFTPTTAAVETGNLTISSNDPDTPTLDIYVEGEGIDIPIIGLSPDTFDVVVPSDTMITQTMTISNTGSGPLLWDLAVEGVGTEALKVDIIGDASLQSARIISRGRSVHPSGFANLRIPVNKAGQSGSADVGDKGMPFTINSSGLQYMDDIEGEEVFGSTQNVFGPGGARGRGNLFTCTTSTTLLEHRFYLNVPTSTTMWFVVAESPAQVGDYALISASDVSPSGTGEGWYSSGSISVPLVAGNYYLIFAQWEDPANYYNEQNISPYPIPASFGELTAGAGWSGGSVPTYAVPPATTHPIAATAFADPVAYYQTIVTGAGVDWLSLNPTMGTTPPGGSTDVTLTFDPTGLLGGDYNANIIVNSNDPANLSDTVGVHMFVDAVPNIALSPDTLTFPQTFVNDTSYQTLTIDNSAAGQLTVSNITFSDGQFLTNETLPFTVDPLSSRDVSIAFVPSAPGTPTSDVVVESNDPDTPSDTVYAQGEGVFGPQVSVTPSSISETVLIFDSVDVVMDIGNVAPSGAASLDWSASIAFTKRNAATFTCKSHRGTMGLAVLI